MIWTPDHKEQDMVKTCMSMETYLKEQKCSSTPLMDELGMNDRDLQEELAYGRESWRLRLGMPCCLINMPKRFICA